MPKVSIVMPMYNQERYISECMTSIVSQSLKDIEIIVMNDGSKDRSLEIVKKFAEKDDRIIIIDKPNSGYGNSMNMGIDRATGEYIGILETDDFVELNMFEELYKVAEKHNKPDVIKSDFYRFSSELGVVQRTYVKLSKDKSYYNRPIKPLEEPEVYRFPMNTWTGIYKREFLNKYNIRHNETPGASYQDNGFWFQTFSFADSVVFVDKAYYMNRRDNPNSSVYDTKKVYCIIDEYKYINEKLEEKPEIKKQIAGYYWLKKYHNYMFTLNRIAYMYKYDFACKMREEFSAGIKANEVDMELFTKKEQNDISMLLKFPNFYLQSLGFLKTDACEISVLVVKTNDYFLKTINSIGNQTYGNIEIFCIGNSFSKDEKDFLKKDKRVKIVENSSAELYKLINETLANVHGKYVHIVPSGTILPSATYERVLKGFKKSPKVGAVVCNSTIKFTDSHVVRDCLNAKERLIGNELCSGKENRYAIFSFGISVANKVFSTDIIKNNKLKLLSFNGRGDSPSFVVSNLIKSDLLYFDKANAVSSYYVEKDEDFLQVFSEYEKLYNLVKAKNAKTSLVNLVTNEVAEYIATANRNRELLFDNREKIVSITEIGKHTRGYYFNNYLYDLINTFCYSADTDSAFAGSAGYFNEMCTYSKFNFILDADVNYSMDYSQKYYALVDEKEAVQNTLNNVYASLSFRVGRFITFVPRKIRDLIKGNNSADVYSKKQKEENYCDVKGAKKVQKTLPLVSIILPMYNVGQYIAQCLDSLLKQTYGNIEIICVDDGSTDDTCQIVEGYAAANSKIKLIKQKNSYAGVARNNGFKHAKGKYTIFLDSDDYFDSDFISTMVARSEGAKTDITVCRCRGFDNDTGKVVNMDFSIHSQYLPDKAVFSGKDIKDNIFNIFVGWAWDKLYRTDFIKKNKLYFQDTRSTNDAFFTFTSIALAKRISVTEKKLINQRRNNNSSISNSRDKSWNNALLAVDKIYTEWNSKGIYEGFNRAFCNWVVHFLIWNYRSLSDGVKEEFKKSSQPLIAKYKIFEYADDFYTNGKEYNEFKETFKKSGESE